MEYQIDNQQLIQLYVEAYLKGDFSGLTYYQGKRHTKQEECLRYLVDDVTREVLYGGAAGGAKSFVGAYWLLMNCLAYPKTRWFIARQELKEIRQSNLPTLQKLCTTMHIGTPYSINFQDNVIRFSNGSEIYLIDTSYQPSDPMYERLGSLEFTGGWFEEGGKIHPLAYEVLKSRTGRQYNQEYGLLAKAFTTSNPTKNFLFRLFYKPHKAQEVTPTKKFIQAFVQDNPFAGDYEQTLQAIQDPVTRQRLLFGNWEWDEEDNKLMKYAAITDIFSNITKANEKDKNYIIVDAARFGKDKAKIYTFKGWRVIDYVSIDKSTITVLGEEVEKKRKQYNVPMSQVLVDEGGVGGGLVDLLECKGFVSNATPFLKDGKIKDAGQKKQGVNYKNLKAQCIYYLAWIVNTRVLGFDCDLSSEQKEIIIEDLDSYRKHKSDADGPLQVEPKSEQKVRLGRSPDDGDVLLMRSYFDLCPQEINYEGTEFI